jgi:phage portal protein BeeE
LGLLNAITVPVSRSAGPPAYPTQSGIVAGPLYLDAFQSKRAPSGWELVEQYKSLIFACAQINGLGVARVPLRLMADGTKGGRPRDVSRPRSIGRAYYDHLRRSGYLSRTMASHQDVQEITEHPLLWCLDHPDPEGYFSRFDLLGLMSVYCDVVGVAYCKIDAAGPNAPPSHLWPMQSQYVLDIKRAPDPRVAYYTYFGQQYQPDELLRFRPPSLSLRDPYGRGYSPTYAALQYAMLEDKYVAIQDQLLGNGPRPNLLVSSKDATMPIGKDEARRYTQDLRRQHARGEAGNVLVIDGAVDVKPISYSPTDLSGMKLSEYDLQRTCNVFGVPISYFTPETNLANLQAAESQHARMAVEPRCMAIAGTLTRLAKRFDERLFFAFDPAVEEDRERDARIVDMGLKSGRITINEANLDSPWEPKEWGDEPWLPGTLKQPTMLQDAHETGMEAAKAGAEALKEGGNAAADEPGGDGGPDAGGSDRGVQDRGVPAVHGGPLDERMDAVLAAIEREFGL